MSRQLTFKQKNTDKVIDAIITTQELLFPFYTVYIMKANYRCAVEEGNQEKAKLYDDKIKECESMLDDMFNRTPDKDTYKRRINKVLYHIMNFLMPNENERKHLTTQHHNLIIMRSIRKLQDDGFYLNGVHPLFEECMDYYFNEWGREYDEIGGDNKFNSIDKKVTKLINMLREEYNFFKYVYELEAA